MIYLALDLSSKTGWAISREAVLLESGTQVFDLARGESPGMRFLRFRAWLDRVLEEWAPAVVFYERGAHRGGHATELLVGMQTRVQELAAAKSINYSGVQIQTLKKFATGKGNAGKPEMIAYARSRWGLDRDPQEDEADALCVLSWGLHEIGGGKHG